MTEEKEEQYITKEELIKLLTEYDKKVQERFKTFAENIYKDLTAALSDLKNTLQQNQQTNQNPQQFQISPELISLALQFLRGGGSSEIDKLKDKIFTRWLTRKDIYERLTDRIFLKSIEKVLGEEVRKEIEKELEKEE